MKTSTLLKIQFLLVLNLFILVSLVSPITAQTEQRSQYNVEMEANPLVIRSHQTEVDITTVNTVSITQTFVVLNTNNSIEESIDLWFNNSLNTLIVEDVEGSLIHEWIPVTNTSHFVEVSFRTPLEQNDTATFRVKYNLETTILLTESDPSYYSFEYYASISHFTSTYTISMILPERSFIHESNEISPFYPVNATQILIKNRIVISWIFNNLTESLNPFFLLRFDEPIEPQEEPFFRSTFTIFLIGVLAGVLLGISGTSWLIRYREKKAMKKLGMTLLTDIQKNLIQIIYDKKGKVSQKELCDITGFSKSKISRNLVPLELRGLISREKWGRTYVVYLTDDGRTVIE